MQEFRVVFTNTAFMIGSKISSMIHGVHLLLASTDPEADRAFFRDVLEFSHVDVGEGWLIFALPPAELGVHPAEKNLTNLHAGQDIAAGTLYLMCDNLRETLDALAAKGVGHTPIQEAGWGIASSIPLPGGANLGLYEPHHPLAISLGELREQGRSREP
jgi:hypothetical protein